MIKEHPSGRVIHEVLLVVFATGVITALIVGMARVLGWALSPWGVAALVSAAVLTGRVSWLLRSRLGEHRPPLHLGAASTTLPRVAILRERLKEPGRPHRFESLRPLLVELALDRLRRRHGIDWERSGTQARDLLGEELWSLTKDEIGSMTPEEVEILVGRIEAL